MTFVGDDFNLPCLFGNSSAGTARFGKIFATLGVYGIHQYENFQTRLDAPFFQRVAFRIMFYVLYLFTLVTMVLFYLTLILILSLTWLLTLSFLISVEPTRILLLAEDALTTGPTYHFLMIRTKSPVFLCLHYNPLNTVTQFTGVLGQQQWDLPLSQYCKNFEI